MNNAHAAHELLNLFFGADFSLQPVNIPALMLGLCLAFLAGLAVSWTYMTTHAGLSYSRSFVNSLVVIPMIVTVVMQVLQNNLVTAFGLMAVFAIVRFRNVLRDTLDTSYILSVIAVGMACGTQRFSLAVIATITFVTVMFFLWYTAYGTRHRYDLIVNLHWDRPAAELPYLVRVLRRHSRSVHCATRRSDERQQGMDLSYRLLLRDPARVEDLLSELRALEGVSRLTSLQAQEESEL
ncbi:MAG: DUF4956 domain-containing protein [Verrucomicrobiota bacterium]|nr:DUF4956 domain-containing protein [Limisphaera sp.]MDW8381248.1 DUF4956 domain-containing protein [Verrucomicrobiota bacterium]